MFQRSHAGARQQASRALVADSLPGETIPEGSEEKQRGMQDPAGLTPAAEPKR